MKGSQPIFIGVMCLGLFSFLHPALALTLVALTNAPSPTNGWLAVACSADGTKFVGSYNGGIYTSTDSGTTWISNAAPAKYWHSVASSADGTKLVATTFNPSGQVWTNSGTTWYATTSPTSPSANYGSVVCSADGTKLFALIAAGAPYPSYAIFASADSGATWQQTGAPNISWAAIACSADGAKLVATAYNTNAIYTSTDSGTNWTPHPVPFNTWFDVSSSADGSKLVAIIEFGGIYTSADSGVTWISNNVPGADCYSVTSSSDGSNIVAVGINTFYNSTNFGQTWVSNSPPAALLRSVACSTNGLKGFVAGATGPTTPVLYAFAPATAPPPLLSLISSNAQLAVAWSSSVTEFQLQQNTNLSTTNWSNVTNSVLLTNGMNEIIVSPTNAASFYRLINNQ